MAFSPAELARLRAGIAMPLDAVLVSLEASGPPPASGKMNSL